jgi:hypothetical protein
MVSGVGGQVAHRAGAREHAARVVSTLTADRDPEATRSAEDNEWKAGGLFPLANCPYYMSDAMSITNR